MCLNILLHGVESQTKLIEINLQINTCVQNIENKHARNILKFFFE